MLVALNDILIPEADTLGSHRYGVDLYKSKRSFRNKFNIYPEGCLGDIEESVLTGYIISLPWMSNEVIPLNKSVTLPDNPDIWYIHDLCVNSYSQGQGIGKRLLERSLDIAVTKGFKRCSLVAVNNSEMFWIKNGFRILETIIYTRIVTAVKMVRDL